MKDTKRILIVEDEPKVAFFLQESLEALDTSYQVVRAASGEDALAHMSNTVFDLVVSDLRMPGISGLELLQRVREQSPTTQTMLITAYGSDQVEAETRRLQACRYFTKPFPIQDFTEAVQQALNSNPAPNRPPPVTEQLDKITQRLSDLRYEVGAQCVVLSDRSRQIIAETGFTEGLQLDKLVALMSNGFEPSQELGQLLRQDRSLNLHYHEGTRYDIYMTTVGEQFFITLIFDRRQGASRVGMVWLYTKRAVQDLLYSLTTDADVPGGSGGGLGEYGRLNIL